MIWLVFIDYFLILELYLRLFFLKIRFNIPLKCFLWYPSSKYLLFFSMVLTRRDLMSQRTSLILIKSCLCHWSAMLNKYNMREMTWSFEKNLSQKYEMSFSSSSQKRWHSLALSLLQILQSYQSAFMSWLTWHSNNGLLELFSESFKINADHGCKISFLHFWYQNCKIWLQFLLLIWKNNTFTIV